MEKHYVFIETHGAMNWPPKAWQLEKIKQYGRAFDSKERVYLLDDDVWLPTINAVLVYPFDTEEEAQRFVGGLTDESGYWRNEQFKGCISNVTVDKYIKHTTMEDIENEYRRQVLKTKLQDEQT